jgi:hypothetical protein
MTRMLLVWSLLFGLALVGADWYVGRGPGTTSGAVAGAGGSEETVTTMEDGTPIPPPR